LPLQKPPTSAIGKSPAHLGHHSFSKFGHNKFSS
jgi:hypothetical protein